MLEQEFIISMEGKMKSSTIWKMPRHTKMKHVILSDYLKGWYPILCSFNRRILYIDGFAGPGIYKNGEKGSPIIALDCARNHIIELKSEIVFVFIEAKEDRCESLKSIIEKMELPDNFKVEVVCGEFNDKLTETFEYLDEQEKRIAPCFVLIDPFGYSQTPFSIIHKIMSNPKCEVMITFMYDSINRFIGESDKEEIFDNLFGTEKWREIRNINGPKKRKKFLRNLYLEQLQQDANIKYVQLFEMINKHNHTTYFLFYCTNNSKGLELMKTAMWNIDKSGDYKFSDRTDPRQRVLFETEPNYEQLKEIILNEFKGKTISGSELKEFIVTKTPFLHTHYKIPILKKMENSDPPEIDVTNRRRRNSYPDNCKIEFL